VYVFDAFKKLQKVTISFVMTVRPSVHISTRQEQTKISYLIIFRKTAEKIQIKLKWQKERVFYLKTCVHFW